jgi:Mn-dependent DtxR family transcriptional regulator
MAVQLRERHRSPTYQEYGGTILAAFGNGKEISLNDISELLPDI